MPLAVSGPCLDFTREVLTCRTNKHPPSIPSQHREAMTKVTVHGPILSILVSSQEKSIPQKQDSLLDILGRVVQSLKEPLRPLDQHPVATLLSSSAKTNTFISPTLYTLSFFLHSFITFTHSSSYPSCVAKSSPLPSSRGPWLPDLSSTSLILVST